MVESVLLDPNVKVKRSDKRRKIVRKRGKEINDRRRDEKYRLWSE